MHPKLDVLGRLEKSGRARPIQPFEGSHSRVRQTRGAMGIQSISGLKALPDGVFGKKAVIDLDRCMSRNHLRSSYLRRHPFFKDRGDTSDACAHTRESVCRASGFVQTGFETMIAK